MKPRTRNDYADEIKNTDNLMSIKRIEHCSSYFGKSHVAKKWHFSSYFETKYCFLFMAIEIKGESISSYIVAKIKSYRLSIKYCNVKRKRRVE